MLKFEAAILFELNKPLQIESLRLAKPLQTGQVLVKLNCSGICGSQIGEITGIKGPDRYLPHLLGHEGVGTVVECGPGVHTVAFGDRVVLHWRKGSGIESEVPQYLFGDKVINAGWVTTFNEYSVVSENRITTVHPTVNLDVAALMGCAITTGFGTVENVANVGLGDNVVVFGAGGIGLNIIQACALRGANRIVALDRFSNRLDLAKKFGANVIIDTSHDEWAECLKKEFEDKSLDLFFDNTGNPQIIEFGYGLTSGSGRVVLVGVPRSGSKTQIYTLPLHFGKTIIGSHGGEVDPSIGIAKYLSLFDSGKCSINGLVTNRYTLGDVNIAIDVMITGAASGRVMIDFE